MADKRRVDPYRHLKFMRAVSALGRCIVVPFHAKDGGQRSVKLYPDGRWEPDAECWHRVPIDVEAKK